MYTGVLFCMLAYSVRDNALQSNLSEYLDYLFDVVSNLTHWVCNVSNLFFSYISNKVICYCSFALPLIPVPFWKQEWIKAFCHKKRKSAINLHRFCFSDTFWQAGGQAGTWLRPVTV